VLHCLAEMNDWLETHVKHAKPRPQMQPVPAGAKKQDKR
jgi:hypothetical protein